MLHRSEPAMKHQERVQTLCEVHMHYFGSNLKLDYEKVDPRDEVIVEQQHCGGNTLYVFREKILPGSKCDSLVLLKPCCTISIHRSTLYWLSHFPQVIFASHLAVIVDTPSAWPSTSMEFSTVDWVLAVNSSIKLEAAWVGLRGISESWGLNQGSHATSQCPRLAHCFSLLFPACLIFSIAARCQLAEQLKPKPKKKEKEEDVKVSVEEEKVERDPPSGDDEGIFL